MLVRKCVNVASVCFVTICLVHIHVVLAIIFWKLSSLLESWLVDKALILLLREPWLIIFFIAWPQVKLQSDTIVTNSKIKFSYRVIAAPSIEVGIGILWVDLNDLSEVTNCFFVASKAFKWYSSVMKGMDVMLVLLNHISVVKNSVLIISKFSKTVSPVIKGFDIRWSISFLVDWTKLYLVTIVFDSHLKPF